VFDAEFIDDFVARAQAVMNDASDRLGGERLVVSKNFLSQVHGCEAKHLLPDSFEWTPANARGFVAHKAIELGAHWQGEPVPSVLVDEALARLANEASNRGDFVATLTEGDRAELRGFAIELARRNPTALCLGLHPGTVDSALSRPFQSGVAPARLFTPDRSAAALLDVIDQRSVADSGRAWAWDGQPIPF
jgi:hypothetical protein